MEDEIKKLYAQVEQLQSENTYLKRLWDEAGIPYTRQKEIAPIVITKQLARRFYFYFWGRTDVYSKRSVNKSTEPINVSAIHSIHQMPRKSRLPMQSLIQATTVLSLNRTFGKQRKA